MKIKYGWLYNDNATVIQRHTFRHPERVGTQNVNGEFLKRELPLILKRVPSAF